MIFYSSISIWESNYQYISVDDVTAKKILEQFGKRFICEVNDYRFHCAIQKSKAIGYYIGIGKDIYKGIDLPTNTTVAIKLVEDRTKYQMELPEEFEYILSTDGEGELLFDSLTPGRQRGLIHYVLKAKQSQTRIDRSLRIIENLKLGFRDPKDLIKPID